LPERQLVSGYAELYKYAFIGGNDMFEFVGSQHDNMLAQKPDILQEGIRRSIAIKARIVSADEQESGTRALLNFGHTFAHAIEHYFNFENVLHGEAVFRGIACACDLGKRINSIPPETQSAYNELLEKLVCPELPARPDSARLYDAMFSDKKVAGGKLRFIVPAEPGRSVITSDIPEETVIQTLETLCGD
ncbi:MAG: 3-dehydroquinate synthase, partial [Chitinivibrionales bacterium]|nr:3-dehydroquinate synthase [Chitinivibrionales bacterium]